MAEHEHEHEEEHAAVIQELRKGKPIQGETRI
jgi:hypothetical protein